MPHVVSVRSQIRFAALKELTTQNAAGPAVKRFPLTHVPLPMSRLYAFIVFYPTLWYNMLMGRVLGIWNWWDRVDEQLIIGAMPLRRDAQPLYDEGVRGIVNTCEEYAGPVECYEDLGINQHRMPTVDFTPPTLEAVRGAVDYIEQQRQQGNTVYVHCKAGRARSATVVICWLIQSQGMTPEQAQQHLQGIRRQTLRTVYQREVVQEFYAGLTPLT